MPSPDGRIELIYDGGCPICRSAVRRLKECPGERKIAFIDARTAPERVEALAARGLDVDEGIVVQTGAAYLSGAEAIRYLAGLRAPAGPMDRVAAWSFGSRRRAEFTYPLFRAFRRLLLRLLRRAPIRKRT